MLHTCDELFQQVIDDAKRATLGDARWINAIDRAVQMLDGNPYVHLEGDELLVMSDTSLRTYAANGSCQCEAFRRRFPCKHRAAKRLLQRYFEYRARREMEADRDGAVEIAVMLDAPLPPPPPPPATKAERPRETVREIRAIGRTVYDRRVGGVQI